MKHLLLLFTAIVAFCLPAMAYEITISDGHDDSFTVPFETTDYYNRSQIIYPASLLTAIQPGQAIKAITFYAEAYEGANEVPEFNAVFEVKMGLTQQSSYSSAQFITQQLTTVFNGRLSLNSGQMEIILDQEFVYTGRNLVVEFIVAEPEGDMNTELNWLGSSIAGGSIYEMVEEGNMEDSDVERFRPKLKIEYGDPATCPKPSVPTIVSHDTASAIISWHPRGQETLWDVRLTPNRGAATVVRNVRDTFLTMDNLSPDKEYSVQVRALCSDEDKSDWTRGTKFNTYIYCVPEAQILFPGSTYFTEVDFGQGEHTVSNSTHPQSTDGYGCYTYQTADLYLGTVPILDLLGGTTVQVVYLDRNRDLNFTTDEIISSFAASTGDGMWRHYPLALPDSLTPGQYRLRLFSAGYYYNGNRRTSLYNERADTINFDFCNGTFLHSIIEDYTVNIIARPTCLPPNNPTVSLNTADSTLILRWTEAGDATLWDIRISTDQGATWSTTGPLSADSAIIGNIAAEQDYWLEARAHCSDSDTSLWSVPAKIHIGYCQPYLPSLAGYDIINLSFGSGAHEVNRTEHPQSGSRYANYYTEQGDIYKGVPQHISITHRSGLYTEYYVMIDFNRNNVFDSAEMVYGSQSRGSGRDEVITFTLPDSTVNGAYRMRVAGRYVYFAGQAFKPDYAPCQDRKNAFAEDYTVNILDRPTCMPPSGLTVTMEGEQTAHLSWRAGASEQEWQIGLSTDDGLTWQQTDHVTGTAYTFTGLNRRANYKVRVRAVCSATDQSAWTPATAFFTGYCEPTIRTGLTGSGIVRIAFGQGDHVIVNNNHPQEEPFYRDFTADTADLAVGQLGMMKLWLESDDDLFYGVYVDLDRDLHFSQTERLDFWLVNAEDMPSAEQLQLLIPRGTPLGCYRIRVIVSCYDVFDSYDYYCNAGYSYMVVEDYTLNVVRNVSIDQPEADPEEPVNAYVRNGRLTIETLPALSTVRISDATGRAVVNRRAEGRFEAELPQRGVYFVTIETGRSLRTIKVVN